MSFSLCKSFLSAGVWMLLAALYLCACTSVGDSREQMKEDASDVRISSDTLRVALLPTVDCLPFFYAKQAGIYDTLGLPLKIVLYDSNLDGDTALLNGSVDGGMTDYVRLGFLRDKGLLVSAIMSGDSRWAIVGSGSLRMKKVENLKGRTVVGERFSLADFLINDALVKGRVAQEDILSPQINSLYLRTLMLNNNQIDAALLPEPFIAQAKENGHRVLYDVAPALSRLTCLAFSDSVLSDSLRGEQVGKLVKGYRIASEIINKRGVKSCKKTLVNNYRLPANVADSVALPVYSVPTVAKSADCVALEAYLKNCGVKSSLRSYVDSTFLSRK